MPFNRAFTTTEVYGFVLANGLLALLTAYAFEKNKLNKAPPFPAETAITVVPELVGWGKTWPRPIPKEHQGRSSSSPPLA